MKFVIPVHLRFTPKLSRAMEEMTDVRILDNQIHLETSYEDGAIVVTAGLKEQFFDQLLT
jgi:hypothetical protein